MDCRVKPGNDGCVSPRHMRRYREPFSVQRRGQFSRVSQRLHRSLLIRGIQEDQCISGRNNILQEAATDAARAKLRRFANRAFRSGLLSRTVEMAAEPGPRRLGRAERQRLLHLIPLYRDHRRVSSNLIALRCLHRGHFPQRGLPSVSERHRYAYGPEAVRPHTVAVEPGRGNSSLAIESMDDRYWRLRRLRDAVAACATCVDLRMAVRAVAPLWNYTYRLLEPTRTGNPDVRVLYTPY